MKRYEEDEYIQLSGIQHFVFCKRQWALIHIESQWSENFLTADGRIMHENAHSGIHVEKRKNLVITRSMRISSANLGISGECDIVEFEKSENGIYIDKYQGKFSIIPIEYKRGKPKMNNCDIMQLVAQAICLEDMFCCEITKGYIYYGETRKREEILITNELKNEAKNILKEMHELLKRGHTPKVKPSKSCKSCSMKDLCLPHLQRKKNASSYIKKCISEA